MYMTLGSDDATLVFLPADRCSGDPGIVQDFYHFGSFLRIYLQHAAYNMSTLPWQKA